MKRSNGYQVPYFVMLDNIRSDLASDRPRSEDDIKGYDRNTEECTIPEEWAFSNYPAMVEDALKYISYYAEIKKTEYKKFVGEVITCLSEAICNGMRSNAKSVGLLIIDALEFPQVAVESCMHLVGRLSVGFPLLLWKVCCNLFAGLHPVAAGFFIQVSHFTYPVEVKAAVQPFVFVFGSLEVPVFGVLIDYPIECKSGIIPY